MIYSSDGFLVTIDAALGKRPTIVLPDGSSRSPIRVASDPVTGLMLLKVAADSLAPVQLTNGHVKSGDNVFAAGFDQSNAPGQIGGQVIASGPASPSDAPALIRIDMSATPGFIGGVLSNEAGQVVGLTKADRQDAGTNQVVPFQLIMSYRGLIPGVRRMSRRWEIARPGQNWSQDQASHCAIPPGGQSTIRIGTVELSRPRSRPGIRTYQPNSPSRSSRPISRASRSPMPKRNSETRATPRFGAA